MSRPAARYPKGTHAAAVSTEPPGRAARSLSVDDLVALRRRRTEDFLRSRIPDDGTYRVDCDAISVEMDRILSPAARGTIAKRAAKVLTAILAEAEARQAAVPPARQARLAFWIANSDPADLFPEGAPAEPNEVRMLPPIVAALADPSVRRRARRRVQELANLPPPEVKVEPPGEPGATWVLRDLLTYKEMIGGVPCQGCGRPYLGQETERLDREPWADYEARIAPVREAFRARHPDHGTSWTVGGGPSHCRRCCPPHPLFPEQIARLQRILERQPLPEPTKTPKVRTCRHCGKPTDAKHVCELGDLPKALRASLERVLEVERARSDGAEP